MERRFVGVTDALRVRVGDSADKPSISGYASVFYDGTDRTEYQLFDDVVERIMPGAFDRALREADDVRALFNHDPNMPLGRTTAGTLTLSIDNAGLRYDIQPGDTTVARDVREHVKRGDVTGSSFSFVPTDEDIRKEESRWIREIRGVRLYDVGPVTFPAYGATSADARSQDGMQPLLVRMELLRCQDLASQWDARSRRAAAVAIDLEISEPVV